MVSCRTSSSSPSWRNSAPFFFPVLLEFMTFLDVQWYTALLRSQLSFGQVLLSFFIYSDGGFLLCLGSWSCYMIRDGLWSFSSRLSNIQSFVCVVYTSCMDELLQHWTSAAHTLEAESNERASEMLMCAAEEWYVERIWYANDKKKPINLLPRDKT